MKFKSTLTSALLLGAVFQTQTALAYQGAEVFTEDTFGHGKFEVRMQFAPGSGVISTAFLWKPGSELADVYWVEADIEKAGADCTHYSSNAIYGYPNGANHEDEIKPGFADYYFGFYRCCRRTCYIQLGRFSAGFLSTSRTAV